MAKKQCPLCGEFAQEHKLKKMMYTYKGVQFAIQQPGDWCSSCGEGIINAKDSNQVMPLIQTEKARIDGLLTPDEIKQVRTELKLIQKEAAQIFGGGVNAFSRYESGKLPIPKSLSQLLKVLRKHPDLLVEIQNASPNDLVKNVRAAKKVPNRRAAKGSTIKKHTSKAVNLRRHCD